MVEDILGSIERWDQIKWGGDWLLERDPTRGNFLPHYNLWVIMLRDRQNIMVYYQLDEENRRVFPLDIQIFAF